MRGPAAAIWIVLLSGTATFGQQETAEENIAEIRLSAVAGFPGKELLVPLHLELKRPLQVGAFRFELKFPAERLTFARTVAGSLVRDMEVKFEGQEGLVQGKVVIWVEASSKPLPSGLLGYLVFDVKPDAPLLPLQVEAENLKMTAVGGEEISPAAVHVQPLMVIDPNTAPVFGCFFYMH